MKKTTKQLLTGFILAGLALPVAAMAADDSAKRIEDLEAKVKKLESKSLGKWLTISGDYRFRYDYLSAKTAQYYQGQPVFTAPGGPVTAFGTPTTPASTGMGIANGGQPIPGQTVGNNSLYTNRFGLDLKAKATQDVSVVARFLMYKAAGSQDDAAVMGNGQSFSLDRSGILDGTIGHVPSGNALLVDRAYATWSNIAEQPLWFSIGRRPSTGGVPSNLRANTERPGNSGVPALLVDYAFDGLTVGYAPDIDFLPGAYAKVCYGRGFQTAIAPSSSNLEDTDMVGFNVVPYETDALRLELQYNRGMNIFDAPKIMTGPWSFMQTTTNIGDIDWYGIDAMGTVKLGNDLNWFVAGAMSMTHPNGNTLSIVNPYDPNSSYQTSWGLLTTGNAEKHSGYAIYVGGRYDLESTGTKLGLEYNQGTKYWIPFTPASDDMWTAKLGTRGQVYEAYVIQDLNLEPISSHLSKAFFKVGYQYYKFEYTGSNSWLGAPIKISDLPGSMMTDAQLTTPLKSAQNLYITFEVKF